MYNNNNQFYYIAGRARRAQLNTYYTLKNELDFEGNTATTFAEHMVTFMSLPVVIEAINKTRLVPSAPFHTAILSLRTEKFTKEVFEKLKSSQRIVIRAVQGNNKQYSNFLVKNKYSRSADILEFKERCLNGNLAEIHQVGYLVIDFESFNGIELEYSIIL